MPKTHTRYVCQQCGRVSAGFMGKCPQCGSFNSMVEEIVADEAACGEGARRGLSGRSTPRRVSEVSGEAEERIPVPIGEFARVLGGGLVPGSIVLVGGDPGIGKSTLMLQMALEMASRLQGAVCLGRGIRAADQDARRAHRRRSKVPCRAVPGHRDQPGHHPRTCRRSQAGPADRRLRSRPSTCRRWIRPPGRSRRCASAPTGCANWPNPRGPAVFVIGHVTKEGTIAGPRVLEHIVDTVLYLEGDRFQAYRLLRSVKNRFGATAEVGVFEMVERGLVEVTNPSEAFLAERMVNAAGSAIAVTMEGTRPLLVEVQGLTSPAQFGNARRTPNGVDYNRLLMIAAVLTRRVRLNLAEADIFVNVVGGLKIDEPAADLAIAAAMASSMRDLPVRADTVLIGEIGLAGELRMPGQMPVRLREAAKLGFKTAIVPKRLRKGEPWPTDIEVVEARSVQQALELAFGIQKELPKGRKVA